MKEDKNKKVYIGIIIVVAVTGFMSGMIFGETIMWYRVLDGIEKVFGNIKVDTVSVGFNETYVMDRLNQTMNAINYTRGSP